MKKDNAKTMENEISENVQSALSPIVQKQAALKQKNVFEKLIPVDAPKTLAEMEIAIVSGQSVGEVAGLRLCKQVARVCREEMYKGSYTSFEKWAIAFKPLNVKNRQAAYNYVNRAALISDDCLTSVFLSRDGGGLVFTLTQLDAIYNAIKSVDEKGAFTVTPADIAKAQKLIDEGQPVTHFSENVAKELKGAKNYKLFSYGVKIAKNSDVETPFIFLSPYMSTRLMQIFLKEAILSDEEMLAAKEAKEARKRAKQATENTTGDGDDGDDGAQMPALRLNAIEFDMVITALSKYAENCNVEEAIGYTKLAEHFSEVRNEIFKRDDGDDGDDEKK